LDAQNSVGVTRPGTAKFKKTASKESGGRKHVSGKERAVWIGIAAGAAIALITWLSIRHWRPRWSIIQGAVIRQDTDTRKQLPLDNVVITAAHGTESLTTESGVNGSFRIAFPGTVLPGQTVNLTFQRHDYKTLEMSVPIRFRSSLRRLVIASMEPVPMSESNTAERPTTVVTNVKVRYTVNTHSDENIGSMVRPFEVVNVGNIPCHHHSPCSPDGYWKASTNSVTLDAGAGNEFRDARASCIAGPCPFTHINSSGFVNGGRTISASATDWSDTATFLLQAEVFRTEIVSEVRESYPVIFGRTLNFTVPPTAEGVSLTAELNGVPIVFPLGLGVNLYVTWATCTKRNGSEVEESAVYQCELKPGFRFQDAGSRTD
jgi:hypothetical protein